MSSPSRRRTIRFALTLIVSIAVSVGILWGTFISSAFEKADEAIAPVISATKVDALFTDVDGDGRADPGDTLLYTVTINNSGADPALNTVFTDTLPNSLTLVPGSVNASPIATDDPGYTAAGNVRITVSAGNGVLVNDIDPDTGNNTGLTASAGITSTNGGNVAMSANGGFSYNPAPGFTGTDTFTYTVTDASGATGTGTVTFDVSGMIWFINAAAGGGGDGRLTNPFNCYTGVGCFSAVAADDPGDNIFLYTGSYSGGNTLLANQRLIGQGAGASLSTITGITPPTGSDALPPTGGTRPSITTVVAATNAVNLGSGNTLRGFNIGNTTAADIAGTSFGTLTASEMELNGTGAPLILTTGTLAATFDNLISTSAPGGPGISLSAVGGTLTVSGTTSISGAGTQGISISGSSVAANFGTSTAIGSITQGILVGTSTGNISFGNTTINAGTDGVSLQNNSAGTRSFGTLSTTNGTGVGFLHGVGGGAATISGTATFTNPGTNCINIQDSTTAITFANVTATQCGATGVFLDDNTGAISFADLDISPDANIRAFQATDQSTGAITTTSGTIPSTGTATAVEIVGTSAASRTPLNMQLTTVSSNGAPSGIILTNTSATGSPGGFVVLGSSAGICGGSVTNTTTPANPATVTAPATGDCTGGTIQSSTSNGIRLNSVVNVSLTRMQIINSATNGIFGTEVNGFQLFSSYISNSGNNVDHDGLKFTDVTNPGTVNGLVGSAIGGSNPTRFINSTVRQSGEFNVEIINRTGTLTDLLVDGCQFTDTKLNAGPADADGFQTEMQNTAVATIRLTNSYFANNFTQGAQLSAIDSATLTTTVTSSTFINNNEGFVCNHSQSSDLICTVGGDTAAAGNHFEGEPTDLDSGALIVASTGSSGTASASQTTKIKNNFVSTPANNVNHAVIAFMSGVGTVGSVNISNNTVNNLAFGHDILVDTPDTGASPNFGVTANNNVVNNNAVGGHGVLVQARQNSTACVDIQNTTGTVDPGSAEARVRQNAAAGMTSVLNLKTGVSGAAPATNVTSAVVNTVLQGNNPGVTVSSTAPSNGQYNIVANNGCTTPPQRPEGADVDPIREFVNPTSKGSLSIVENEVTAYYDALYDEQSAAYARRLESESRKQGRSTVRPDDAPSPSGLNATLGITYQPLAFFTDIAALEKRIARSEARLVAVGAGGDTTVRECVASECVAAENERNTLLYSRVSAFFGTLANMISPTAYSQEKTGDEKEPDVKEPESGETITVNGSGTGFTLPSNKSTTITFRAVIGNALPAATTVTNQGSVSGNFTTVLTDDPDIAGTADPTVTNIDHTTVAVASNANPSVFGQNVTFTATMTGVPTRTSDPPGTVQFKADGVAIGAAVPVVIGALNDNVSTAQASIATLAVGTRVITAEYSGGGSGATGYNANIGTLSGGQVVGKANTTTGLTSSQNPSVFGQPVTFTATVAPVAPGAGTPTGTINFFDGGNPIVGCQNVALQSAQAQCQPGSLAVGNHTITTTYSGDGNFNTSNGTMTGNPQVVNKANTSVALVSSQNPAPQGTTITFTATISVTAPGAGTPSGTVQFRDGVTPITGCTAVAVAANSAVCMTNALTPGNHTISAVYSGDGSFNTATGNLTGNPQVITGPPILTPTAGLTRIQGNPASNSVIATVSDDVSSPGAIIVTAQTVPSGMQVTNIVNTNGSISADVRALCSAATGNNTIVLRAADGKGLTQDSNLVINVTANPAPTLGNYANQTVVTSCKLFVTPDAIPADNQPLATVTATSPTFTGTLSVDPATGLVTASNSGPIAGSPHTVTVTATDSCGLASVKTFTITVTAAPTATADFDFDGDRKADLAVYRAGATPADQSTWFVLRSSDLTVQSPQFGVGGDRVVTADYNGDGTANFAVYRPSTGVWYTSLNAGTNYDAFAWGATGDIPVPGRYDADANADHAVFRPSTGQWWIFRSTGGAIVRNWGVSTDLPIAADYDGDGITDVAVYRPSTFSFHILRSTGGSVVQPFGTTGDKLVPADYDGDGKDDIAIWRPSTGFWFIIQSGNGQIRQEQWGLNGDVPVPADYDNDGKADLAVFRPSDGRWWIFSSCPCVTIGLQWGIATDKPVPSAFTP